MRKQEYCLITKSPLHSNAGHFENKPLKYVRYIKTLHSTYLVNGLDHYQ
jgi:hypothetical protein